MDKKIPAVLNETRNGINTFYAPSAEAWRSWLQQHGEKEKSVWLIFYKKESGVPSVNYSDAVDEALCFGWIDSTPGKRDEKSFYRFFARRKPQSGWSKVNKEKTERLLQEGRIAKAGLEAITAAKAAGTWTALDEVEKGIVPDDLQKALTKNGAALKHFADFPKSSKKIILDWIRSAKREETRKRRIDEAVKLAAENLRANHYRQPAGAQKKGKGGS